VSSQKTPEFFDGEVLKWRKVPGLAIGEICYLTGRQRPKHGHKHACFHFLLQGGYAEHQGSRSRESKTLSRSFQPSGFEHRYRNYRLIQRDLLEIFGTRSVVSAVLKGKRAITRQQAVKLGRRFSMDPTAFIDLTSHA
jgi:hypothetical protein